MRGAQESPRVHDRDGVPVAKCSGVRVSSNKIYAFMLYSTIALNTIKHDCYKFKQSRQGI